MTPSRTDCEKLLHWAMPVLGLDWSAYRHVRGQVLKRLRRRLLALGLRDLEEYRGRLLWELPRGSTEWAKSSSAPTLLPPEWGALAALCRVTVSRFYRDRYVFDTLRTEVLPRLAENALARGARVLRCWCAGCGAGEEAYSVSREVRVPGAFRRGVSFLQQDLRRERPVGQFDLILCRNMAFSYFDTASREMAAHTLCEALIDGGALVLGKGERLPANAGALTSVCSKP